MGSKINAKLGLRPATRKRTATHARQLAPGMRCPVCSSGYVLRTESTNGKKAGAFWCASCSAFFS